MSRRREAHPLEKCTFLLYEGDLARLRTLHPHVAATVIVRELVRGHINRTYSAVDAEQRHTRISLELEELAFE